MKRRTQNCTFCIALLLLSCQRTVAADLESFEFNDPAGTALAFAANTANSGNQWIEDPEMFPSDIRNGAYNITLESTILESNYLQIDNITSGTYYLTARMSGWKFGSTLDTANLEEVRFGFLNDDTSPTFGSTITAQMMLRRNAAGDVELVGDALGAGSANIAGAATFAATRATPLTVALEINKTANTYKVFYKDNTLATQVLGMGAISPSRNGNSIRFATNNSFDEGNIDYPVVPADEVFSIDRIALSDSSPFNDLITLEINRANGAMTLRNTSGAAINGIESYTISSPAGGLNPAGWTPIAGGTNSSSNTQFMQTFGTAINLTNGQNTVLSNASGAWLQSPFEDLRMALNLTGGATRTVNVNFINNDGKRFAAGDLNFDGDITAADYVILAANAETNLALLSAVDKYRRGDLGGDGLNSIEDFIQFKTLYEQANGAGSFTAMLATVPEPSSLLLVLSAIFGSALVRRRAPVAVVNGPKNSHSLPGDVSMLRIRHIVFATAVVVACGLAQHSTAAILEDFTFSDSNGTTLDAAANSVNPSNVWSVTGTGAGELTNSSVLNGVFRIQKTTTNQSSNYLDIANITAGKAWLVAEIAGWLFTETASSPSEEVRFTFLDNDNSPPSGSTITAQMDIGRLGSGLALFGRSTTGGGTGFASISNSYALPLSRSTPFTMVLELDKDADQYSVYFKDDANPFQLLGTANLGDSTLNPGKRDGNSIRFAPTGNYSDAGEFFDINRIYLTNTSPIIGGVDPVTLTLEVRSNGQVYIKNETANPISFDSYRIASGSSSLNFAGWNSLADQGIDPFMGGNDPGEKWTEAGGSSDAVLSESFLLSATTIAPDAELSLGNAFKLGGMQDLTFQYRDTVSGALPSVVPTYVTVAGVAGDYNSDGTVNAADYTIWRDHLNQNFQLQNEGGVTPGVVNQADYDFWKSRFGATMGSGSNTLTSPVPEPGTMVALMGIASVFLVTCRPQTLR